MIFKVEGGQARGYKKTRSTERVFYSQILFCFSFAQAFDQARFFARGGIFVDDAFLRGRIEFDLRLPHGGGGVLVAGINGLGRFFGDGAGLGFDQTIALAAADIFANFFLGGSGICQFDFLRWNYKSDCDTQNFKSCVRVVILLEMRESAKFTGGSGR